MVFYRTIALFSGLILVGISIFMFLEDQDRNAKLFVFLSFYVYFGIFYVLKGLYYFRHRATFNEISFVVFLPVIPIILVLLGEFTELDEIYSSELITAQISLPFRDFDFNLSFSSIFSLPYFSFSLYLLLRTFIRYEHIRWRGHSKGGPNATFVGLLLSIVIGVTYFAISLVLEDLLLALFGFIYAIVGIFGFLA